MNPLDDFIERLTARLRPDKELAAEVGHEMRSHIEDAVEEARREGMKEDEAYQHAIRRFGDPTQIADQLWTANFRRMRLRAIAKWGFRLVAAPVALLFALLLLWEGLDGFAYASMLKNLGYSRFMGDFPNLRIVKPYEAALRSDVSEKDAAVYAALQTPRMVQADRCVELYPDKPMFRANRLIAFLAGLQQQTEPEEGFPEQVIRKGVALADDGERLDPDNAFFNYVKAVLLLDYSGAVQIDKSSPLTYLHMSRDGTMVEGEIFHLRIRDPKMFEEGLAEFRKGVAKPHCDTYVLDAHEYMLSLERPRRTLLGLAQRVMDEAGILLPHLAKFRAMNRIVIAHAGDLVGRGNHKDAADLLAVAAVPGTQLGQTPDNLIALLVAKAMRSQTLYGGSMLYDRMGMNAAANAAKREAETDAGVFYSVTTKRRGPERREYEELIMDQAGIMGNLLFTSIGIDDYSLFKPVRTAERAVVEGTVVGVVALILLLEMLLLSIRIALCARRVQGGARGVFIGWRKLAIVLLVGVIIPVGAYVAYTRSPVGSTRFGVNAVPMRIALEMSCVVTAMLVLLNLFGRRAIRSRAVELGMAVPKNVWAGIVPASLLWCILLASLGVAVAAWDGQGYPALIISVLAAISTVVLLLYNAIRRSRNAAYSSTEARSLLPILIAALLLLGLFVRFPLSAVERKAVAALQVEGRRLWIDEMEYSSFKTYRTYLQSLPDHGRLNFAGDTTAYEGQKTE